MNSLIDLHSYGHDIEAAWLMDRCLEVLGDEELTRKLSPVLRSMEQEVYEKAYTSHSLANECERGVVDMETLRITNQSLIQTLDEVVKIQDEGRAKRRAAEQEIGKLEGELKQKLLDIHQ